jgi:hypothetical protein
MTIEPILDRGRAALATFNDLLMAELVAGNAIAGTPAAACGRLALALACALMRECLDTKSLAGS